MVEWRRGGEMLGGRIGWCELHGRGMACSANGNRSVMEFCICFDLAAHRGGDEAAKMNACW